MCEKPDIFSASFERLVGSAAPYVESVILKNLYSESDLTFAEKDSAQLADYIRERSKDNNVQ